MNTTTLDIKFTQNTSGTWNIYPPHTEYKLTDEYWAGNFRRDGKEYFQKTITTIWVNGGTDIAIYCEGTDDYMLSKVFKRGEIFEAIKCYGEINDYTTIQQLKDMGFEEA